jgi:hypothetical protein
MYSNSSSSSSPEEENMMPWNGLAGRHISSAPAPCVTTGITMDDYPDPMIVAALDIFYSLNESLHENDSTKSVGMVDTFIVTVVVAAIL